MGHFGSKILTSWLLRTRHLEVFVDEDVLGSVRKRINSVLLGSIFL